MAPVAIDLEDRYFTIHLKKNLPIRDKILLTKNKIKLNEFKKTIQLLKGPEQGFYPIIAYASKKITIDPKLLKNDNCIRCGKKYYDFGIFLVNMIGFLYVAFR